jgi:N-methylhydantoinase A
VPARPGITNALGCVVADLGMISSTRSTSRWRCLDEARVHDVLARHREEGEALIAKEAVAPERSA